MDIIFGNGVIQITTSKGEATGSPYFKVYYGAITGVVTPSNYDSSLNAFYGIEFKINGDIYEINDASQLTINGSYPGGAYDCINALLTNLKIYTYTNPAY